VAKRCGLHCQFYKKAVRDIRRIIFPVLSNVIWNYNKLILLLALFCISNPVLVFLSEPAETQTGTANSAEAHRDVWNDVSSAEKNAGLIICAAT
jgi:hypothetical protein